MKAPPTPGLRFFRGVANNLVWLGPTLWLAWPRFAAPDLILWLFVLLLVILTGVLASAVDPISFERRADGTDGVSEVVVGVAFILILLIGAADLGRWSLGERVPSGVRIPALVVMVLGYALRIATCRVNTFFSGVILIQADRGHGVIDRGPYAFVRHPGYASLLLILPSAALALGSLLALLPMAVGVAAVLRRTKLEDEFLIRSLEGYSAYAARVRFRLIPWVY